jgi:dTMP kinase
VTSPLFISFEGPDGSGKSTQAAMLARVLRSRGVQVVETREPGGTAAGEHIRGILLDPQGPPLTPLVMALLLSASRAQLLEEIIVPALKAGKTVVTDRFADSTLAYQGYGLGLDRDVVRGLSRIATGGRVPNVSIYVDIDPILGLERVAARGAANRLDNENLEFHRRVRNGYFQLMSEEPARWRQVDGSGSPEEVHRDVVQVLDERLRIGGGTP